MYKRQFLHRIRALRDICGEIHAGDIGGFVESESNLSAEPGDCAWIFDDAIAAGDAYVDRDACLRGDAIACGSAYVSKGSVMSGHSRAEDNAYLRGASMTGKALASGNAQILHDPHTMGTPILSGNCKVYGLSLIHIFLSPRKAEDAAQAVEDMSASEDAA